MSKANPHYTILKALYDLYNDNKNNKTVSDKVAAIGWALEHELHFDTYGYFELAELINYGDQKDAAGHYIQVIEESLRKLRNED